MKTSTRTPKRKATSKIDLASPVSMRVELENILLEETVARRKPHQGELRARILTTVQVVTEWDRTQCVIRVRPHFALVACLDDVADDELLRIEATFLLQYRVSSMEGLRKPNITAFGETNGLYNAWPYWREFVHAMTVRMGFPALTIAVFRPASAGTPNKGVAPRAKRTPKKRVSARAK